MNSEITVYDIKKTINDKIDEHIKDLFDIVYKFDKVIDINNLNYWCDDLKYYSKLIKKLLLLENRIDNKYYFTDDEISWYHILACKPERIKIINKKIKKFNPVTKKLIYENVEYVE